MSVSSRTLTLRSCLSNMFVSRGPVLEEILIRYDSPDIHGGKNQPHSTLPIQNQVLINPNPSMVMAQVAPVGRYPVSGGALGFHAVGELERILSLPAEEAEALGADVPPA